MLCIHYNYIVQFVLFCLFVFFIISQVGHALLTRLNVTLFSVAFSRFFCVFFSLFYLSRNCFPTVTKNKLLAFKIYVYVLCIQYIERARRT